MDDLQKIQSLINCRCHMSQAALKEELGVFNNPFDAVTDAAPDPVFGIKQM